MRKNKFTLEDIETMGERSNLFLTIKRELEKRGHWKNKPRGVPQVANLKKIQRGFTTASMQTADTPQVEYNPDEYSQ